MILKNAIGLLGGTFNPIHTGHIQLALTVTKSMNLAHTQLIPCAIPPHKLKAKVLPFALRVMLLKTAIQNFSQLSINTLESKLPSPSYTWNMLIAWKKNYPNHQPVFILSCEEFSVLHTWYNGIELPSIAHFLVVPRGNSKQSVYIETLKNIWNCTNIKNTQNILCASPFKNYYCFFLPLTITDIRSKTIRKLWNNGFYSNSMLQEPIVKILQNNTNILKNFWYT